MRDIRMQRPRAVVCATAGVCPEALAELRQFQEEGGLAACICYGSPAPIECDQVILDEEDNTYQSAQHLLSLGHRRLGFYKVGPARHEGPRAVGFRRALTEFRAEYNPAWHFYGGAIADQEESGAMIAQQWAALPADHRPTGMCIVNDQTAQGFIVGVQLLGLRVPEDVSVVGHDDQPSARFGRIPLTTVSHPVAELVNLFVSSLRERLGGYAGPPRQAVVKGKLIVRDSTMPPVTA
jgi:DNA-binding LacI/PurR family transcriptional regulator